MVTAVLMLMGCTGESGTANSPTSPWEAGHNSDASSCEADRVDSLVREFLALYNDGEAISAAAKFADADSGFQWYSDSPNRSGVSRGGVADPYDRDSLANYFTERHETGDQMLYAEAESTSQSANQHHFALQVNRPEGLSRGKLTVDCSSMKFIVWSMGQPQ